MAPQSLADGDDSVYMLIRRWDEHTNVDNRQRYAFRVRYEQPEGVETTLIGVWVAVGGSGEDGGADLAYIQLQLSKTQETFSEEFKKAKALWDHFTDYCFRYENISFTPAELWLTSCEVA